MYKYKGDLTGEAIVSIPSIFSQDSQALLTRRDLTIQSSDKMPNIKKSFSNGVACHMTYSREQNFTLRDNHMLYRHQSRSKHCMAYQ